MTFARLAEIWKRFWFSPTSPSPMCLFRILYGLVVVACAVLWIPDALTWFGQNGPVEPQVGQQFLGGMRINPLMWFQSSDTMVLFLLGTLFVAAIFVTLGFCTRFSLLVVWILLVTFQTRNPFIMNVGDDFLRIAGFLLMLSPAGTMYSLDACIKRRLKSSPTGNPLCEPWAQRLLQIEIAAMYFQAFFAKLGGESWWNGTAVYTIMHVGGFGHMAMPGPLDAMLTYQIITWSTLVVELSMWTLIWFKETRYWVLLAGLLMHVGIDVFMTLPLLLFYFTAAYSVFVFPDDMERAIDFLKHGLQVTAGKISVLQFPNRGQQHV